MNTTYRFKAGEIVYDRTRPNQRMVIVDCDLYRNSYTCVTQDSPQIRKITFPARELKIAAA